MSLQQAGFSRTPGRRTCRSNHEADTVVYNGPAKDAELVEPSTTPRTLSEEESSELTLSPGTLRRVDLIDGSTQLPFCQEEDTTKGASKRHAPGATHHSGRARDRLTITKPGTDRHSTGSRLRPAVNSGDRFFRPPAGQSSLPDSLSNIGSHVVLGHELHLQSNSSSSSSSLQQRHQGSYQSTQSTPAGTMDSTGRGGWTRGQSLGYEGGDTLGSRRSDYMANPSDVMQATYAPVNLMTQADFLRIASQDLGGLGLVDSFQPFVDLTKHVRPPQFGVLKISRIPYNATKQEITTFVGAGAKIIETHTQGCPVNIMMDRTTSKTMDCFVEFKTVEDLKQHYKERWSILTRPLKIGNRTVYVDLETQDDFLRELFPRARNIFWNGGIPVDLKEPDPALIGFQGFITDEELYLMAKQAELPHRFQFSEKALQRTYECMISTLYKFPWYARKMYTVGQRNRLFIGYMQQLDVLVSKVYFERHISLNRRLLLDFLLAGLNCPGFSERQKFTIFIHGRTRSVVGHINQFSEIWPFDILSRKQIANDSEILVYMKLIETGWLSLSEDGQQTVLQQFYTCDMAQMAYQARTADPMYNLHFHINVNVKAGNAMTFETAANYEVQLCKVLLKIGSEVMKTDFGVTPHYMFDNEKDLADLLATLRISDTGNENAMMVAQAPHTNNAQAFRYSTPRRAHSRNQSSASEDLINSGRSSEDDHRAVPPNTPLLEPAIGRATQSTNNLQGAGMVPSKGFKFPPPSAPRSFFNGTGQGQTPTREGRLHRRMSSADDAGTSAAHTTPQPASPTTSGRRHSRSTSVPGKNDFFGIIGSGRSTNDPPTPRPMASFSTGPFLNQGRQGIVDSPRMSQISSRVRLNIDQTIHEETEDSASPTKTHTSNSLVAADDDDSSGDGNGYAGDRDETDDGEGGASLFMRGSSSSSTSMMTTNNGPQHHGRRVRSATGALSTTTSSSATASNITSLDPFTGEEIIHPGIDDLTTIINGKAKKM